MKKKNETALQVFNNEQFGAIRSIVIDGEIWFIGKDVATSLGYKDHKNALKAHVDEEDKRGWQIATPSGKQTATLINESGLYSLVFLSQLESAKKFKRWITSEVLPSIRKTGEYKTPQKQTALDKLTARLTGKKVRKLETDLIKFYIDSLIESGQLIESEGKSIYAKVSAMCNAAVGLPKHGGRDTATPIQLHFLMGVENQIGLMFVEAARDAKPTLVMLKLVRDYCLEFGQKHGVSENTFWHLMKGHELPPLPPPTFQH